MVRLGVAALWLLTAAASTFKSDAAFVPSNTKSSAASFVSTLRRHRASAATFQPRRLSMTTTKESSSDCSLHLYNSRTRTKEKFVPLASPKVSMYTCGPTVYDSAHVGNFRAFLTYDVLKRVLEYLGFTVKHVCNLTDVDDKIIARCREQNVSLVKLTRTYEGEFFKDLEALNIVPAQVYPRATEHIQEMVQLVLELKEKGLAYASEEGSWYFNVAAQPGYGQQLAFLDNIEKQGPQQQQRSSSNTDADEYSADKMGVRDFCLWKARKPQDSDDATWDTAIGTGRPGWHLECSAMARKYLGDTIDIHCGGIDLKFPHHENEIAQSEGATGTRFCNCWIHNGFVNIGDEKMSKSKGNFLTLRAACPKADDVRAYRYLVVSSHYRNPLSFTEGAMSAAKGALKRMDKVREEMEAVLAREQQQQPQGGGEKEESEIASIVVPKELKNFELALADDLSMPRAAAALFGVVKAAENEFKRIKRAEKDGSVAVPPLDLVGLRAVQQAMEQMDRVFGVFYQVPKTADEEAADDADVDVAVPNEVMELVVQRSAAKESKDWELADSLRARIAELGFSVKDIKGGEPLVSRLD